MCNQQGRTGGIATRLYVDSRSVGISRDNERRESGRLAIRIERRGVRRYACSGMRPTHGCVRSSRDRTWDDLPWGRASRHARVSAATHHLSALRDPNRACRVRRSEGSGHSALAAADRHRLPVDAHESRGSAAWRELGQGPPRRKSEPRRVGSHAREAPAPPHRPR